jgi:hypothetical protein
MRAMSERVEEAMIRAALVRAARVWEGRGWTGPPTELLFELAGHAIDPLSMPVNPRAFSVYLRRVAPSLPPAGVEVIPWKSRGARLFTVRPLPVRACRDCRGTWYRLTSYSERIHAHWVCGHCDPPETNPTLWLNVQLGSEPHQGYWRSQRRPEPPAMSWMAPPGGPPPGADPVLSAVRELLEHCGETRLGPLSWIGPMGELLERVRETAPAAALPRTPDRLSRRLRAARRELLALAVEVEFPSRGRERLVALRRIPAAPCRTCRGAQFWFHTGAWQCGRCAAPQVNPSTWFDLGGLKDLAETAAGAEDWE